MKLWLISAGIVAWIAACGTVRNNEGACDDHVKNGAETDVDCGGACGTCGSGFACATEADCVSGNCVDGVCCNNACKGACMACSAAKTDAANGECAPVTAGMDPDSECTAASAASCGAAGMGCNGSATAPGCVLYAAGTECVTPTCAAGSETGGSSCDGAGRCVADGAVSCGAYACNPTGTGCLTQCDSQAACAAGRFCDTAMKQCLVSLRVAIQSPLNSACRAGTDSIPRLAALLTSRGHKPTVVTAADIDTLAEISAYHVVVIAGAGSGCNSDAELAAINPVIAQYVTGGGGVLSTGWMMFETELNSAPQLAAILPTVPAVGSQYTTGPGTLTPVPGHPITTGVGSFMYTDFANQGNGTRAGATTILTQGTVAMGAAWQQGNGRAVYLAPLYVENEASYANENLLDNTQPAAVALIMRSIEWLGRDL